MVRGAMERAKAEKEAECIPVSGAFLTGCSGKVKESESYTYLGEEGPKQWKYCSMC